MANIQLPEAFAELFDEEHRYLVFYGGRGSGKSYATACALIARAAQKPLRILCAREMQNSIKESVHQLLKDIIIKYGLESFFDVLQTEIRGKNGSLFTFAGLKHNVMSLKSKEGYDICWCEEAQVVSKHSWDILIPTIRKPGSQFILTLNPDLEEDYTYQRFIIDPPSSSIVKKVNYNQNPFFPDVLEMERTDLMRKDYEAYLNVWEGQCRAAVEGAVFAKELADAVENKRITDVPYDKETGVCCFFDLGRNDKTAIWFGQLVGMKFHLIDYYESSGEHFSHYLKVLKDRPYTYDRIFLPHDARREVLEAHKSIEQQTVEVYGRAAVKVVERVPKKALAIDSARSIFNRCYFDKTKCKTGLTCLKRYAYKYNEETQKTSPEPEHDTPWSHGADAFLTMAQHFKPPVKKQGRKKVIMEGIGAL